MAQPFAVFAASLWFPRGELKRLVVELFPINSGKTTEQKIVLWQKCQSIPLPSIWKLKLRADLIGESKAKMYTHLHLSNWWQDKWKIYSQNLMMQRKSCCCSGECIKARSLKDLSAKLLAKSFRKLIILINDTSICTSYHEISPLYDVASRQQI